MGLNYVFLPEHALIWNCPHTPGSGRKLRNVIVIVFYIYSAFHNAINHVFIIYGLDAMVKSLQSGSFEVCTLSRNGVVCLKLVYYLGPQLIIRGAGYYLGPQLIILWTRIIILGPNFRGGLAHRSTGQRPVRLSQKLRFAPLDSCNLRPSASNIIYFLSFIHCASSSSVCC